GRGERVAAWDIRSVELVDITLNQMVALRPIVPVRLYFARVDVVRKNNLPSLPFEGEPHQADSGKELGGGGFAAVAIRLFDAQPIAAVAEAFERQIVAGADMMVLVESPDPGAVAEEGSRLARVRVGGDVGLDHFA